MKLFIDVFTAWMAVILMVLLAVIYLLRVANKKIKNPTISAINKKLRKAHIPLSILFIVVSAVHGYFSTKGLLSLNFGTICMLFGLLLGLSYWLRKAYKNACVWIKVHRVLTVLLLGAFAVHMIQVGGPMGLETFIAGVQREANTEVIAQQANRKITDDSTAAAGTDENSSTQTEQNTDTVEDVKNLFMRTAELADGTYTGVADGLNPGLTVEVTVQNNQITSLVVTEHNENKEEYYGRAIYAIPEAIIAAQTPVVDAVSGATYTSTGIMQATINALQGAVVSGQLTY